MKCDICGGDGTSPNSGGASNFFKPDTENKTYCLECKEKAEQDGTASWLPQNREQQPPGKHPSGGLPGWFKILLVVAVILLLGLILYFFLFRGSWRCRWCGSPKASCNCPLWVK